MRDCEGFPKQDLHANLSVTKSVLDQIEALDRELTAGRENFLLLFVFIYLLLDLRLLLVA